MAQNDFLDFCPHIGLASGRVIVGYVGTPIKYNCSVFGAPVALAARCAGVKPDDSQPYSTAIVFPAAEWGARDFDALFPPDRIRDRDGQLVEQSRAWELLEPREVELKNVGSVVVREILQRSIHIPSQPAHARAREALAYWRATQIEDARAIVREAQATK